MSYLQERVFDKMGVTQEQNTIKLKFLGLHGLEHESEETIFSSDDQDNIKILVYGLDRFPIVYDKPNEGTTERFSDNKKENRYYITRFKEPRGDQKYKMPSGVGTFPFIPPALVDKYEQKQKIKTLFLTEGYFKAFKSAMHGFDIIGLSSISTYRDKKTKQLHPDIIKIINVCDVKNVVLLYDGDCRDISTKALERKEDLAKRPRNFLSSALNIRELLINTNVQVYFSHVLSENILPNKPKGIDDLLIDQKGKEVEILNDILQLGNPGIYFYRLNITSFQQRLQPYLNLKNAEQFYSAWNDLIKDKEFIFNGSNYKYDEERQKLEKTVPRELKNYYRIGDTYYEKIKVPNAIGGIDIKLVRRLKQTILDDFGEKTNSISKIAKFKTFINLPSNTDYQQIINNCYNIYTSIDWLPEEGTWNSIREFLKHIFQEHYELGLDYLQIIYTKPTQVLPILCLVSSERKTGKDTFLNLLKDIFKENCAIVGNSEISSDFNSFVASKLIVGINESQLADNAAVTERIKMLSTSKKIPMTAKGQDTVEVDHFAKYIFCSNNETNFIYTQTDEIRFWVRKVSHIEKEDPDINEKMRDEIPAFLQFLNSRKISVARTTRMWFEPKDLETEALRKLKERQRPKIERIISEYIKDTMIDFQRTELLHTVDSLRMCIPDLKADNYIINRTLKESFGLEKQKQQRFIVPKWNYIIDDNVSIREEKFNGRPFLFKAEQFLNSEELLSITAGQIKQQNIEF